MHDPLAIVALALVVGMGVQAIAHHLRIPGIVLLLLAGVALGPEGVGVLQPDALGHALEHIVSMSVAVILFEGALSLRLARLRGQAGPIRRLLTLGAGLTNLAAAAMARLLFGWPWAVSVAFGALMAVTGPTVIGPLLQRVPVRKRLHTILHSEGVFIDGLGGIIAAVAFEAALIEPDAPVLRGAMELVGRVGAGLAVGGVGGLLLAFALRREGWIPHGLENVFTLAVVLALFAAGNVLMPEAGLIAAISAGVVVGNTQTRVERELREFKEQLTVLLIGMLFVLLAAKIDLSEMTALGWRAGVVVAGLMFVARPMAVFASTWGSELGAREKLFLSWLAPRGIVAAAVASFFADALERRGVSGAREMRALVFVVIATTVTVQGLLAGPVATWLRVRRPTGVGYLVLGANALARVMARALPAPVVLMDTDPDACAAAEAAGLSVIHGDGLDDRVIRRGEPEIRAGCLAITPNEAINLLFVEHIRLNYRAIPTYAAVHRYKTGVQPRAIERAATRVLFGGARDLDYWNRAVAGGAPVETWTRSEGPAEEGEAVPVDVRGQRDLLALTLERRDSIAPVAEGFRPDRGDRVTFVVAPDRQGEARAWLREHGWQPATETSATR